MKNRKMGSYIRNKGLSSIGRVTIVTGARQTGKTTLLKKIFPDYSYISIDDPVMRTQYTNLTATQWQTIYPNAILDEIQKEPALIDSIKAVYDRYEKPRYILTGSSQLLLLHKIKESLAGRCQIAELYPLTLPEMHTEENDEIPDSLFIQMINKASDTLEFLPSFLLDTKYAEKQNVYDYYLKFGGYPALVNKKFTNTDRYDWLYAYIKTYLERDVRDLADFRNLEPFVKAQKMAAINTGQLLNYSSLAKEAGISPVTAQKFMQYLEISYQIILLQPWHRNSRKRLVKTPKIHFIDPGIQTAIIQKRGELTGNEFESAIIAEIYKQLKNSNIIVSLYHLRTQDGREVDLILEFENYYIAIEIKQTISVKHTDAKHLNGLEEFLDKPVIKNILLSNDPQIKKFGPNIIAIPAAMFLSPYP